MRKSSDIPFYMGDKRKSSIKDQKSKSFCEIFSSSVWSLFLYYLYQNLKQPISTLSNQKKIFDSQPLQFYKKASSRDPRWRTSSGRGLLQPTVQQNRFRLRHSSHFSLSGIVKLGHSRIPVLNFDAGFTQAPVKSTALGFGTLCLDIIWLFMVDAEFEMNSHTVHLNSKWILSQNCTQFLVGFLATTRIKTTQVTFRLFLH